MEQVLLEMFCDSLFECQELKFGRMIVLFMNGEDSTTIGD